MTKEQEIKNELINFQIRAVDLLGSYLYTPKDVTVAEQNFSFNLDIEQKVDNNQKAIIVITNIDISSTSDLNKKLGSISTACVFTITNFNEVIKIDQQKLKHSISDKVIEILNSISISSTRGVMSQVFRGTFLHHAILPVLDPKAFNKSAKGE